MNQLKKLTISTLLILITQLKNDYYTKINDIEKKITDHDYDKYITTQEQNKLTVDNFSARLPQGNVASQDNIDDFLKKDRF